MKNLLRQITIAFFVLAIFVSTISAQTSNNFNQRDDTYTLLGLKRAKQSFETARSAYERQKTLFHKGLINDVELERAKNGFVDAEVNYQQSLLAVIFEAQYVTVSQAIKYQGENGEKRVRVTLMNTSGGSAEFQKMIQVDDQLFRTLQPGVIPNVYISILNNDLAIVSQPYESKIEELVYGYPVELDFKMLQDLDQVNISIIYGNGAERTLKIFLQKDETVDQVLVQSEQFSQEVDLGNSTSFDLTLEKFGGKSNTFSLEVLNLPRQIGRFFKSGGGQFRLTQVKFTESSQTKSAALEISLPDRPGDEVIINTPISFYVLVMPNDKLGLIRNKKNEQWTEETIKELQVGYVKLELVPRGKGELLVRAPQLFQSIESDDVAEISLDLINEGSHRLDNIELRADLPTNWRKQFEPNSLAYLEIGIEKRVILTITPPEDVAPGKYNIRVRTSGISNGEPVSGENKTITIEIKSETSIVGTLVILLFLGLIIGGIVMYGIRLSKR